MTRIPKKYEKVVDHAVDLDRRYFEEHPEASEYVRDLVDGEFFPMTFPPGTKVRVVQIEPGFRQRMVLSDEITPYRDTAGFQASPEVIDKRLFRKPHGKKRLKRRQRKQN